MYIYMYILRVTTGIYSVCFIDVCLKTHLLLKYFCGKLMTIKWLGFLWKIGEH